MPKALTTLCHGSITVEAGQEIPATFTDLLGQEHPTDWEHLLETGVIKTVPAAKPAADEKHEPSVKSAHRGRRGAGD